MQQIIPMQARPIPANRCREYRGIQQRIQCVICRIPFKRLALPLAVVALLAIWQGLVVIGGYPSYILPGPLEVADRLIVSIQSGILWQHIGATGLVALSGFVLALATSSVLGYLLAHTRWLDHAFSPILAASQAVPILAIAPLIILWLGTGWLSKIVVAALITFFPMLLSTTAALRSVPRELCEMALINGADRWQLLWYVEAPLALPVYFSGVRTGLALATTGAVVSEFVAGREGLGSLITIARGLFDTPLIFVALLTLATITMILYLLASLLERALIQWEG